jgi:hypothetical protein
MQTIVPTEPAGRVLVACPTYAGKEYCVDQWIAGFNAISYADKFAYQVDNTRISPAFYELLKEKGVDCTHLVPWPDWDRTFYACWKLILQRAQALDCYWVFSVEADNVPAPESLRLMTNLALLGKVHLVTHACPMHASAAKASGVPENSFYYHELGCTLISRSLLERAIAEFEEHGQIVTALFATCDRYHGGYMRLTNAFKVEHLDGYEMAFNNLGPSEIPGLMYPTEKMPEDYGTQIPPSLQEKAA